MEKNDLLFMMDDSVSDNKESIIDYMLSWTLRMSSVSNDNFNNVVRDYCKKILFKIMLVDIDMINENYKIIQSVKIWKQWRGIDLCAEIEFIDKNENLSKHALLIEDKAYSSIHGDQLNRYKNIFEEHYKGTEFEENLHYVYFTIKERDRIFDDEILCKEAGYIAYTMEEIREYLWPGNVVIPPTGNEIFDEFWIKNWG
ncbi:MAG: PD-(D/E)XK nuclease family protein [Bacteroidetes bacterium]|nr:PD-(D/E)XK nuclease family protein [Bacteroidota bacterium]